MSRGTRASAVHRPWEDHGSRSRPFLQFLFRAIAALVVLAAIGTGLVLLRKPLAAREKLRTEIVALERERDLAQQERDRAAQVVDWIQNDPGYLEVIARDALDLYRVGETVFRIDPARRVPARATGGE